MIEQPGAPKYRADVLDFGMEGEMEWTDCSAIEVVPGKVSGAPVIRGTRVRPEDLLVNRSEGIGWLSENFNVPVETIREVLGFYDAHGKELVAPAP